MVFGKMKKQNITGRLMRTKQCVEHSWRNILKLRKQPVAYNQNQAKSQKTFHMTDTGVS